VFSDDGEQENVGQFTMKLFDSDESDKESVKEYAPMS